MSELPRWLHKYIDTAGAKAVSQSVAQAEMKTSGEIVPIVVRRSSTLGHVPVILFLMLAVVGLVLYSAGYYSGFFSEQWWVSASYLLVALFIVRWLAPQPWIQRLLTPRIDQAQQVEGRALIEFYNHAASNTENHTGILLFISMLEHQAVVLADKSISEKLPADTWDQVVAGMLKKLKQKDLAGAMTFGVKLSGDLLEKHFPRLDDDKNELPNHLIIKD